MKAHTDSEVKSHLIRFGFVNDYTVWTFHGEKAIDATTTTTVVDASREKTSLSMTVNVEHVGREPVASSLSAAVAAPSNDTRDYVTMDDFFQDVVDKDGGEGGDEDTAMMDPQGAELMEEIANQHDEDHILFGILRWLENFKEMKQATINPLYNGCPKHWTALRFNL
jgi:hypothetical protein